MSAGGLSYSALQTNRRVTLPSVEMWGTNMNIIQDPHRSLQTRKIDKVGDTQGILLSQDASGDRIAEMIQVYARGVNPMVSVSYDNAGNNAGSRQSITAPKTSVKLPYRPEVFRPPIVRPEQLMPLSRQPREWFYALTNPMFPQVAQEASCSLDTKSYLSDRSSTTTTLPNLQYHSQESIHHSDSPTHSLHPTLLSGKEQDRILNSSLPRSPGINSTQPSHLSKGISENKLLYSALTNSLDPHMSVPIHPSHSQHKAVYESILHSDPILTNQQLSSSPLSEPTIPPSHSTHSSIIHPECFTNPRSHPSSTTTSSVDHQASTKQTPIMNVTVTPSMTHLWKSNLTPESTHTIKEQVIHINYHKTPLLRPDEVLPTSQSLIETLHRPLRSEIRGRNIETTPLYLSKPTDFSENTTFSGKLKSLTPLELVINPKKEEKHYQPSDPLSLPRRTLLIQNTESAHCLDPDYQFTDLYDIQSREVTTLSPETSSKGSFDALGSYIPTFSHMSSTSSPEMPIDDRFMQVKRQATHTFMDRFHQNPFPQN